MNKLIYCSTNCQNIKEIKRYDERNRNQKNFGGKIFIHITSINVFRKDMRKLGVIRIKQWRKRISMNEILTGYNHGIDEEINTLREQNKQLKI